MRELNVRTFQNGNNIQDEKMQQDSKRWKKFFFKRISREILHGCKKVGGPDPNMKTLSLAYGDG